MNYGQKIAELRKGKNLTQAELGAKLNVTAQAVSKWENGLSEPDIDLIKKICEIFEVSLDEFVGNVPKKTEQDTAEQKTAEDTDGAKKEEAPKIIRGYCETCKKPLEGDDYVVSHDVRQGLSIKKDDVQHMYCKECHAKILKSKKAREDHERETQRAMANAQFRKGLIWGGVIAGIVAIVFTIFIVTNFSVPLLIAGILTTLGSFGLASCISWDCWLAEFFLFFCRSFKAPFFFIFELSLDGIIWLLTVKLVLWIICGILSALFFLLGLFLSLVLAIFAYPFIFAYFRKHPDEII